ncbi:MAG: hypothetical protein WCB44_11135, partial [Stellaceae bacterium]
MRIAGVCVRASSKNAAPGSPKFSSEPKLFADHPGGAASAARGFDGRAVKAQNLDFRHRWSRILNVNASNAMIPLAVIFAAVVSLAAPT